MNTRQVCEIYAAILLCSGAALAQTQNQNYDFVSLTNSTLPENVQIGSDFSQLQLVGGFVADASGNVYFRQANSTIVRLDANGILTRIAGNGIYYYGGDGGPATEAAIYGSGALALDSAGNLYLTENSPRVRMVSNGVITTIAGNGTYGYSGDGGPATSAQLNQPSALMVNSAGDLFILDRVITALGMTQNVIRKVSKGVITTVETSAGLTAASPPGAIAPDGTGNFYFAVNGSLYVLSSAQITLLAQFGYTQGIVLDSTGDLYVSGPNGETISKISNDVLTRVAGNGTQGYSGDNGPAVQAEIDPTAIAVDGSGNLYIEEMMPFGGNFTYPDTQHIRKVSAGLITTVAGVPSAAGSSGLISQTPFALASDGAGSFYFSDIHTNLVSKLQNGVITTVAGGGTSTSDGIPATQAALSFGPLVPSGLAADAAGNLYIAQAQVIRKVTNGVISTVAGGGTSTADGVPALSASLGGDATIALDSAGNIYFADVASNRIRKISNGIVTTIAGSGTAGFSGDGGPALSAQLNTPTAITVDSEGNVYFYDSGNFCIRVVSNGVIHTFAGNGANVGGIAQEGSILNSALPGISALAAGANGDLYYSVANYGQPGLLPCSCQVEFFAINRIHDGAISTLADFGGLGVAVNNGNVYFSNGNDVLALLAPRVIHTPVPVHKQ